MSTTDRTSCRTAWTTALVAALGSFGAATQAVQAQAYDLVWSDEFSGTSLSSDWERMLGTGSQFGLVGWGNNELQYYTSRSQNIQVSDGTLKIIARRENFGGRQYTSARLRTLGTADLKYGKIEARMKLPSTKGIWPAFWMLSSSPDYGTWAASGEIDIMESVNTADRIYNNMYYGGYFPDQRDAVNSFVDGTDYSAGFHTFTLEWEPHELRYYTDGVLKHRVRNDVYFSVEAPGNPWAPFDRPFHLLLNVAVGGNFPGNPDGSSVFPQTMEVDWVRAYERVQSPFGGTAAPIPGVIEAENFDEGGGGVAYLDADWQNRGNRFRDTAVDLENASTGGFNVGYLQPEEWLEYTVDAEPGTYIALFRVASASTGGFVVLEDGNAEPGTGQIVPPVQVLNSGGWQSWVPVASDPFFVAGGEQVFRLRMPAGSGEFNIDSVEFIKSSDPCIADLTTTNSNPGDTGYGVADGSVDGADISYFVEQWLADNVGIADLTTTNTNPGDAQYGIGDGVIDGADLSFYVELWLSQCA